MGQLHRPSPFEKDLGHDGARIDKLGTPSEIEHTEHVCSYPGGEKVQHCVQESARTMAETMGSGICPSLTHHCCTGLSQTFVDSKKLLLLLLFR